MGIELFLPIVSHKRTKEIYRYIGNETFQNIRTNESGIVSDELASKIFWMEPEVSEMINEYPQIADLISTLNLKLK